MVYLKRMVGYVVDVTNTRALGGVTDKSKRPISTWKKECGTPDPTLAEGHPADQVHLPSQAHHQSSGFAMWQQAGL
jgi:hypothetical protein